MKSGPEIYRRFAKIIPSQEIQLTLDLADAAKQRQKLEKDLLEARIRISPKARKKRKEIQEARELRKSAKTEKFEAIIKEKSGTRKEQISRLPRTKKNGEAE